MGNQITKDQHYVSDFLLRYFRCDTRKGKKSTINIFDIKKSEVSYNQPTRGSGRFSQNYFYDKDNLTEKFIADKIEAPASGVIDKIVNGNFHILSEDMLTLHRFISSLYWRTPEANERVSKFINSMLESIIREGLSLNGFDPEEASAGKFDLDIASLMTHQGFIITRILGDLEYHIIKNETQSEFYISDHPVFIYNWLYRNLEHPEVTSFSAVGLQIFLPLSPKLMLCLYDPKVYKYGQRNSVTYISDDSDIEILNSFQIINSSSVIGFHSKESEAHVKQLYKKYKGFKLHHYESKSSIKKEDQEEIISTHSVFTRQAKLKKMPSFIKIKRKSKGYASSYQERDTELKEDILSQLRSI